MPDADGRFKGLSVPAEAWERIFGREDAEARREIQQRLADRHEREKALYDRLK